MMPWYSCKIRGECKLLLVPDGPDDTSPIALNQQTVCHPNPENLLPGIVYLCRSIVDYGRH